MNYEDQFLPYLDKFYLTWLKASWSYHYDHSEFAEVYMDDPMWDALAKGYAKNLDKYPYLKSIGFTGSTMGVNVDEGDLLREIERVEALKGS